MFFPRCTGACTQLSVVLQSTDCNSLLILDKPQLLNNNSNITEDIFMGLITQEIPRVLEALCQNLMEDQIYIYHNITMTQKQRCNRDRDRDTHLRGVFPGRKKKERQALVDAASIVAFYITFLEVLSPISFHFLNGTPKAVICSEQRKGCCECWLDHLCWSQFY